MMLRTDVTVAPDGSQLERNANGCGSSGGETAPPEEALPSTTKNNHVGTTAHRLTKTVINDANDDTANRCRARMPHSSTLRRWRRCSNTSSTTVNANDAASARAR